jgi:hypothetical protein
MRIGIMGAGFIGRAVAGATVGAGRPPGTPSCCFTLATGKSAASYNLPLMQSVMRAPSVSLDDCAKKRLRSGSGAL